MTNFPAPDAVPTETANGLKVMDTAKVVAAAHERCGHGEEVHAALKSDLAAGVMPSGRFGADAAWLWLAALALNALALLRRAAYGPEWRWMRMKRIRAVWIHLVARIVRHGRRVKLVLGGAGAHLMAARQRMNLAMPPPAALPPADLGATGRHKATQQDGPGTPALPKAGAPDAGARLPAAGDDTMAARVSAVMPRNPFQTRPKARSSTRQAPMRPSPAEVDQQKQSARRSGGTRLALQSSAAPATMRRFQAPVFLILIDASYAVAVCEIEWDLHVAISTKVIAVLLGTALFVVVLFSSAIQAQEG